MSDKLDVVEMLRQNRHLAWQYDDDPLSQCGSANADQDEDYDTYFDPEEE